MDRVYVSYFYQIRFFTPDLLPLSTAVWDPKWYHNNGFHYLDNNGVLNGCRAEILHPDSTCDSYCISCTDRNPESCAFLRCYLAQLQKIDFKWFMEKLEKFLIITAGKYSLPKLMPVFIVHEAPYNPCSERVVLNKWFTDNGIVCREWNKEDAC